MNYLEFINMIPEKTRAYVVTVLDYLKTNGKFSVNLKKITNQEEKIFYILLGGLYENYFDILNRYETDISFYKKIKRDYNTELDDIFLKYSTLFLIFNNNYDYQILTPLDIFLRYRDLLSKEEKLFKSVGFENGVILNYSTDVDFFIESLEERNTEEKEKLKKEILENYFKGLDEKHIRYLETAGKIYIHLINKEQKNTKIEDSKRKIISLMLAIFYMEYDNNGFNLDKPLSKNLNNIGINITNLIELIKEPRPDKIYMKKILENDPTLVLNKLVGKNAFINNINLEKALIIIFKYEVSKQSLINVLNELGVKYDDFINVFDKVLEEKEAAQDPIELDEFYQDIPVGVVKYFNDACKVYKYLLNNYKIDGTIIQSKNDLTALALLMSSYYNDGLVANFFIDNNIDLERLEILLGINLEYDILYGDLDTELLIKTYKNFIEECEDTYNIEDLTIENVEECTLTDSDITKTKVLNRIYEYFTKIKLPDYFYGDIDDFNCNAFEKNNEKIDNELYGGLNEEVKEYIKKVAQSYGEIEKPIDENIKEVIALFELDPMNELLQTYIVDNKILEKILKTYVCSKVEKTVEINKIVKEHFLKYIYEGNNINKKKHEITIESIIENITYYHKEIMDNLGIQEELLINLNEKENSIKEKFEQKKLDDLIKKLKKDKDFKYLTDAIKIYENVFKDNNGFEQIIDDTDAKSISIVLSDIINKNDTVFVKNGLNIENLLNKMNIPKEKIDKSLNENINFELLFEFEKIKVNNELLLRFINQEQLDNINYYLENGKEKEPTKEEQLEFLKKENIVPIKLNGIESLVNHGEILIKYTNIIIDEIKNITVSNSDLTEIDNLVNKLFKEEKTKKNLFSKTVEIKINNEVLEKLNIEIDDNIANLNNEIIEFDFISRYIEALLSKINEYKNYLQEQIIFMNDEIKKTYDYSKEVKYTTFTQILDQKINSFEQITTTMKIALFTNYQRVLDHFINIDSLNISKIILTLIESELFTSKENTKISNDLIELFHSVLKGNVGSITPEVINKLNIPVEMEDELYNYAEKIKTLNNQKRK